MATKQASLELDRLVARWAPRAAAEPATARVDDVATLLHALTEAIKQAPAFTLSADPDGTKLVLALAFVEDARRMSTASRDEMTTSLDELEDVLDGLFVATPAPAPGGAARG